VTTHRHLAPERLLLNKVPQVTLYFWMVKVLCTTVGETAAEDRQGVARDPGDHAGPGGGEDGPHHAAQRARLEREGLLVQASAGQPGGSYS
jgi:hypothetical protein